MVIYSNFVLSYGSETWYVITEIVKALLILTGKRRSKILVLSWINRKEQKKKKKHSARITSVKYKSKFSADSEGRLSCNTLVEKKREIRIR